MAVTVNDILGVEGLRGAKIVCGNNNLSNIISTATVMNILEIKNWLKAEELLITAFPLHSWLNEEALEWMKELKIPALITKEHFATNFSEEMLQCMDQAGIPLIFMRSEVSFSDILHPIMEIIISDYNSTVSMLFNFQRELLDKLKENENIENMCTVLEKAIKRSVSIVNVSVEPYEVIGPESIKNRNEIFESINKSCIKEKVEKQDSFEIVDVTIEKNKYNIIGLKNWGYENIWILILDDSPYKSYNFIDKLYLEQFVIILIYALIKKSELESMSNPYYSLIFDRLLAGQINEKEINIIGLNKNNSDLSSGRMVIVEINTTLNRTWNTTINRGLLSIKLKEKYSFESHKNIVYNFKGDRIYAWINNKLSTIETIVEDIVSMSSKHYRFSSINAGISSQYSINDSNKAFKEAALALNVAKNSKGANNIYKYESLGIIKYFNDNSNHIDMNLYTSLITKYIQPLLDYDRRKKSNYFKTLEVYFDNMCSPSKASEILFIHKNTLLARIKRIKKILNISFEKADDIFELQLALKFYQWENMK